MILGKGELPMGGDDYRIWRTREQQLLKKMTSLETHLGSYKSAYFEADSKHGKLEPDLCDSVKDPCKQRMLTIEKELFDKQRERETTIPKGIMSQEDASKMLKLQNDDLRNALAKMTAILRDKTGLCQYQEKRISALTNQVDSLKEVVVVTKDLLNIRNLEIQHLSRDISAMESKIEVERERHNQMLVKMDEAVRLNTDLKKEYEDQLTLFQLLRERYEEKVRLLAQDRPPSRQQEPVADKVAKLELRKSKQSVAARAAKATVAKGKHVEA